MPETLLLGRGTGRLIDISPTLWPCPYFCLAETTLILNKWLKQEWYFALFLYQNIILIWREYLKININTKKHELYLNVIKTYHLLCSFHIEKFIKKNKEITDTKVSILTTCLREVKNYNLERALIDFKGKKTLPFFVWWLYGCLFYN